ncbi:MAG: lysine--tRNA ligase [Crocinitomicaceae bacterium]|nr:lysine--tRNA ligase [Crocinitomicaceae bacterium]
MNLSLSEEEIIRRQALDKMRQSGIDPFPAALFPVTHYAKEVQEKYEEGKEVVLAGRMMNTRVMGKATFADLHDSSGKVQIYLNVDQLCPGEDKSFYNDVVKHLLHYGDFVGVSGKLFTTRMGEISVNVTSLKILAKSLKPLPVVKTDKEGNIYDAFTDPEGRYRMRYVDLVVNEKVKETFILRTGIVNAMRHFFNAAGYLEVDTPVLQPIPGGATARPFITHHNALDVPMYLRIANELYLKRLIVGGFDGVYEFSRNFRNEGMDRTHNPEFTVLEIYVAYKDYQWMMDFTEKMLEHVCREVLGSTQVKFGEKTLNFQRPFRRLSMTDAIKEYAGFDITGKSEEELAAFCKSIGIEVNNMMGKGKLIDEIFGARCEGNFIQPTFITDYPVEMSPLCKRHRSNPDLTERFELMINGKEVANAYSELNDPIEQRARFEEQLQLQERGDDEAMFIDHDFLRALEYGMPPTSGMGIGIDRLVMLLTNNESIQEVLFFPQMRPEKWQSEPDPKVFIALGIPEQWAEILIKAGFPTVEKLKEAKPTSIHQTLNGYRKKNKLEMPALQLNDVQQWLGEA